ncbi:hypothetical protein COHA_003611 [Chlorella ohadii]|uniref:malate synthase n=1 Tax=Chlorella ohadii TaxID=2649997 RepID=A0AAD5DRM3_9CHLO|nr:hypothetical protein COHA_003611 [Chlorella ohadii]
MFRFAPFHARSDPSRIFPDRGTVTMAQPFLRAYTQLVIQTCHRRAVHAIGGMSALIPVKGNPAANEAAFEKVRADKLREVQDGHDGTWVAHPGLIAVAKEVFDAHMREPNQIASKLRLDVRADQQALLKVPEGPCTVGALRNNISVSIQYLEAWLGGNGCVPLHNLMEDAATAEISRASVWQWVRYGVRLDDGQPLTADRVCMEVQRELDELRQQVGNARFATGHFLEAAFLFKLMVTSTELEDFLTLKAYDILVAQEFGPTWGAPQAAQPGGGPRSRM